MAARDLLGVDDAPLPALRTHGYVALIDDDDDYVHTLEELLGFQNYNTVAFTHPAALHEFLARRLSAFSAEQRTFAEIWRAQLDASGTAAERALQYFASPARLDMPLVLVSDYAMPAETGVSLCSRAEYRALERVLLTGVADNAIAVSAFNIGAIDQFVQKQAASFPQSIMAAVDGRLSASATRRSAQLANALQSELSVALRAPGAAAALRDLFRTHAVREYMMLGQPQGVLAITDAGAALWVQLETEGSLNDLDDVLELAKSGQSLRQRVRAGEALVAPDFMKQIAAETAERPVTTLCRKPLLIAAVHPLTLPASLRPTVAGQR